MASRRRHHRTAASLLVLGAATAGCAGLDLDVNPFHVGRVHEDGRGDDARVTSFGPLWDDARSPGSRETALHPLWRRVETAGETRVQVLDPLYAARRTNDETTHRFLALSFAKSHRSPAREPDYDFMLFPILWAGSGPDADERYFALLPLFGSISSFAGFAEVGFVLFPLWYWARKEITEPETFYNVTPLIGWTEGGPREKSWRVLPLAGRWSHEGRHDKWTFLWPIVHVQRNRLDTSDPTDLVTVWPLFSREKGPRSSSWAFLWPFFRFRSERVALRPGEAPPSRPGFAAGAGELAAEGGPPAEHVYFHHDFLWPLYRRQHDREFDYVRLFPFYSRYASAELRSEAFAIPLVWRRRVVEQGWTKETFDVVPLVHWERKRHSGEGLAARPDDTAFKLWPLVNVANDAGAREITIPAPLPLDIERFTGDFLANWGPLFELWRTRCEADGSTRGNALFRLFDWESRDGRTRFSMPLLYSYDGSDDGTQRRSRHSLLLGLIRFGGGEGGAELRLLGLPVLTPDAAPPGGRERGP